MCYHTQLTKDAQSIENRFNARFIDDFKPSEHYNGFSHKPTPIITDKEPGQIQQFEWGLIPFWAKDNKIQNSTLNARAETLTEKPSYKSVINKHCLIIVDGFFEWKWQDPTDKKSDKIKHLITWPKKEIFTFAGLYSTWDDTKTGEKVKSYTIITTAAKGIMKEIHNSKLRMPFSLKIEDELSWLDGKKIEELNPFFQFEASTID